MKQDNQQFNCNNNFDLEELVYDPDLLFNNLVLDVKGASKLLKVSTKTVYDHLDEIPHIRVGNSIRFFLPEILKYLKAS